MIVTYEYESAYVFLYSRIKLTVYDEFLYEISKLSHYMINFNDVS